MKIGRIETFFVAPRWLFVRVESDDGAVGWGKPASKATPRRSMARSNPCATDSSATTLMRSRTSGRWLIAAASTAAAPSDERACGPRAGALGPQGQVAEPARLADAGRQGPRQDPCLRLDRRRPPGRDRGRRHGTARPGLFGGHRRGQARRGPLRPMAGRRAAPVAVRRPPPVEARPGIRRSRRRGGAR